jgi:hypothetical protein
VDPTLSSILGTGAVSVTEDGEMSAEEEAESACPEQDASDFDDFGVSGGIGEDVDEEAEDSDEEL